MTGWRKVVRLRSTNSLLSVHQEGPTVFWKFLDSVSDNKVSQCTHQVTLAGLVKLANAVLYALPEYSDYKERQHNLQTESGTAKHWFTVIK